MKVALFIIIFSSFLWGYSFEKEIISLIGKENYYSNRGLINLLFKDKEKFLQGNKTDLAQISKVLEENNLLNLKLGKISDIELSFATKQKNSLLFVKIVKEVLSSIGYSNTLTKKAIKDSSGFLWTISLRTRTMIDPYQIVKEFSKRGAIVERIKRNSKFSYRYDVDIFDAKVNAISPPPNQALRLKKPLKPYWIDVYGAKSIKIVSLGGNRWHPYIVFYDSNLKIIDNYTKERKSYNISIKIPRGARYIKISDLYTLQNIKRGMKITVSK